MFGWLGDFGLGAFIHGRAEAAYEKSTARLMAQRIQKARRDETERVLDELAGYRSVVGKIRERFRISPDRDILTHFEQCDVQMRGLADRLIDARTEINDLRASNARMADVFSSIRDRLGLDDGGSILDALDDLVDLRARLVKIASLQSPDLADLAGLANFPKGEVFNLETKDGVMG